MKMLIVCALLSLVLIMLVLPARAESAAGGNMQAYDWSGLGTIAGATAATLMIVQLIKAPLDKVLKIPTRLVVYAIALIIMLLAQIFGGGLTAESAVLAAINAVMVALSAYGAYEVTFKSSEGS
jgi:hypothetical protein